METARRSARGSRRRRSGNPLFVSLLTAAVESSADAVAVRFHPAGELGDQQELTYRQLDERSSRLARELIDRGVGPGAVVAIGIARSVESVLAVWAIAKTGAAYVPVDPSYPAERIRHMLTDSGADLGLTVRAHRAALGTATYWLELDDPIQADRIAARPSHPVSYADRVRPIDERHPAYLIYTSGSTGRPKGVVVSHAGLGALVSAQRAQYGVTDDARVLHICSPNFDVSVLELLLAFSSGATLVIAPPGVFGGAELADLVRRERVTHMLITPGALESVDPSGLADLEVVVVAGDKFGPELLARWADQRSFHNGYGPTEATILATSTDALNVGEQITIGSPVSGVTAVVLDARLRPVPAGVVGELYLAGPALAQGYLGQPGLTAERFVASPFLSEGVRLYRTGDLVRRMDSGVEGGGLEYLGRSDFQVKIRGFRIELTEIDSALTQHPEVDFAVTLGAPLPSGATALVSYVLAKPGTTLDAEALLEHLGITLPTYMIPTSIMLLDEIPLTPVGKLDRAALPKPMFATQAFRAPGTPLEETVAQVYADLLFGDTEPVGADDDFFARGGNSLLAAQAAARIGTALGRRVRVEWLFEASTVSALAARLAQQTDAATGPALTAMPRPELIPMSYAQQRMWFLNRFDPASALNNIPVAVRLTGQLDHAALQAAIGDLVVRHEVLRTRYPEVDGAGYQEILAPDDPAAVPDLPVRPATAEQVPELVTAAATAGFDVTTAPPVRLALLELDATTHVLICVVHHIAGDGFSMAPLTRDLMAAYLARVQGSAPSWAPLPVQYADFALWQREVLGTEDDPESLLSQQIDYWRKTLAGLGERLDLPTDRPRPTVASYRGATVPFTIDASTHAALERVAQRHNVTLFMVLHAALAVLLARLSATRDIAIGTPVAGRGQAELDDMIGMFVNTLVLRTEVDPALSVDSLLEHVHRADVAALGHAEVPFERLVELLDPVRSMGHHPLFQVMLTFQNTAHTELELPGLGVSGVDLAVPLAKFDLQLTATETPDAGIVADFTYATDLFDAATVQDFADRFTRVLTTFAADTTTAVGDIDVLAPGERELVLREWNTPGVPVPEVTVVDVIATQAWRRPDAVAIRSADRTLTFRELHARANAVARALIAQGVGPESLVAVAVPRTAELPIALLGVLTAGAGYLPMDTAYPQRRLAYLLEDAQPVAVLTTTEMATAVPAAHLPTVLLDDLADSAVAPVTDADRLTPLRADNLAYVIYTSGSTGQPKGVPVTHRNVLGLFANTQLWFEFTEDDVWTLFHSFAFDFSVWELLCALASGGSVVVVDYLTSRSPESFRELLVREKVTVLNQTPSAFYQLAEADRVGAPAEWALRYVIFGGEALDPRQLSDWYDRHAESDSRARGRLHGHAPLPPPAQPSPAVAPRLVNMYGITETTVHVSFLSLDRQLIDNPASMIGRALPGLDAFVLDDRLNPAPVGVAGEIQVAGAQVTRGYLGRPGLAATRFVANPYGAPGSRMYRTGDVARWVGMGDGASLEYAGRSDQQVQLRGFRIELGEVAAALQQCPEVGQAVAIVRTDSGAGERLIGYVVPAADRSLSDELDPNAVREQVAQFLTGYMVPDAIVVLGTIPMTPNGKLDRAALPAPEFGSTIGYRAPATPVEQAIAEVFAELLGAATVGRDDDFFALGGNSLVATRAISRINQALDAEVSVRALFENSTVAGLAAAVEPGAGRRSARALRRIERPERIPLSLAQQRIWVINQFDPTSTAYNLPMALRLSGALDVSALRYAVADILERHEVLRTRYPAAGHDEVAYQEILPVNVALPGGLELVTTNDPISQLTELLASGFDVTQQVPIRVLLLGNGRDEFLFAMVAHHIAVDGASMAPLARDLMTAYLARVEGNSPRWTPLEVQFADFALWQRAVIGSDKAPESVAAQQLAYWREQLRGLTGTAQLPLDRPRPAIASLHGASAGFTVPSEVHTQLNTLAREHNATLFMVVHAALAVLVARLSGDPDVAIGTPIAGRGEQVLDDLVGMFVNTLALRTPVRSTEPFTDLVARARETDLAAFTHADIPFERVVEEVVPGRSAVLTPLFTVLLSFQNNEQAALDLPGLTVSALDAGLMAAKFDLQVNVEPRQDADGGFGELVTNLIYATDVLDESSAQSMARRLAQILTAVATDPKIRVGDIDIFDAQERERLTEIPAPTGMESTVSVPSTALAQALAASVEEDPDGPAIVSGEEDLYSYAELDAYSSQLARVLIAQDCGPGTGVALRCDRGVLAVAAVWAVVKAGAALVPLAAIDAAEAAGLKVTVGVTTGPPASTAGVRWMVLDDPAVAEQIAEQSPRTVTYAHRTRALTGTDVAYCGRSRTGVEVVSFDELAAMVARVSQGTTLTYESRIFGHGAPDGLAAFLEVVAAGVTGAAVILLPGREAVADELADDWVTHLFTDPVGLTRIDPGALADLDAVVLTEEQALGTAWSGVGTVVTLTGLRSE